MIIIKLQPLENGAFQNMNGDFLLDDIPDDWGILDHCVNLPETFPFIRITSTERRDGHFYITGVEEGVVPPIPPEPTPEPTTDDVINALLGVEENE